jgi:hypothetical protein
VTTALLVALWVVDRPSPRRWAALGAMFGVAALTRGEDALLVVVLAVPLCWWVARRDGARLRAVGSRAVGSWAMVAVAAAAVVLPWTVRNAVTFHAFVPISDDLGGALSGSNCAPTYNGPNVGLWLLTCDDGVKITGLDEAAAAARYRAAGIRYASAHAGEVPRVVAIRVLRVWGLYHPRQQVDFESLEGRTKTGQTVGQRLDWLLFVPALAGAWVLRRKAEGIVLVAPAVVATVGAALTYGNERFREAAEPAIIVLAVVGLLALARRLATRRVAQKAPVPAGGA